MTLIQRPGSRFFKAFYRWNRCTQRTSPCPCPRPLQARHLPRHTATPTVLRSYHATCRLRSEGASTHSFTQELEGSSATDASTIPNIKALLKDDVRNLMRRVPCCVAIATVAHVDSESGENVPMGIAVSSLSTVTLDPPTISFNIKEPSQTLNAIRAAQGSFRVHWLAAKGDSVPIIQQFTQGNNRDAYLLRRQRHVHVPQEQDRSTAAAFTAPQIRTGNLIAAAECVLTHELPVGDHIILVAQIKSLEVGDQSGFAMAYVDGSYRAVANGPEN